MGFNRIELDPIYHRFDKVELKPLAEKKNNQGPLAIARAPLAGLALYGGVAWASPVNADSRPAASSSVSFSPAESPESQIISLVSSFRLPDGTRAIFDRRANGMGDNPATNTNPKGYVMAGLMLEVYENNEGDTVWGPVISKEFTDELGRKTQYTQRNGFQIALDVQRRIVNTEYDNIFDRLGEAEVNLDDEINMIPKYADWSSDSNLKWGHDENGPLPGTIEENHIQKIFNQPQPNITPREQTLLKDKYLANKKWFEQYGLPMGIKKYANGVVAVVAQRAGFHLWPDQTPWSQKDVPVIVLGGDVLKKLALQGLVPRYVDRQVFQTQDNPISQGGGGTVETTNIPERPFADKYEINWPDGKSFTVINPGRGRKGWVLNPDKVVQLPVRDPNTFIPIRDTEGNPIMRSSTAKDELKTAMDDKKVPEILFIPAHRLGLEKPTGVFSVGGGTTTELDKKPYLYFDVIVKLPALPNALVYAYEFADDETQLDAERKDALFASIGVFLGRGLYEFASVPANTIIRSKEGTPADLGVMMYTLERIKLVEHTY